MTTPEDLLAPFKAHYSSEKDMQKFIDNPGSRSVFIMTYDSHLTPEEHSDSTLVHFNCGLETLVSTMLLKRDSLKAVDYLEVVKIDLALVREWLFGGKHKIDTQSRMSLERLALDLDHPN